MKKMLFFMATIAMLGMLSACNKQSKNSDDDDDSVEYSRGCYEVTFNFTIYGENYKETTHMWFDSAEDCEDYYTTTQQSVKEWNKQAKKEGLEVSQVVSLEMKKAGKSKEKCAQYEDYQDDW